MAGILENIFGKRYICVFCDDRMPSDTAQFRSGSIGICRSCYDKIEKSTLSLPYESAKPVAYVMAPFIYKDAMREAILNYKFKGCYSYAPLFAKMSEEYIKSFGIWDTFDYIIPIPLHAERMRERGYNQSELIAAYVSEYTGIPMHTDILARPRTTKRQSSLDRHERMMNVKNAFACNKNLRGKSILLFDDIYSTGSTLSAAAAELFKSEAEYVCALTLAMHDVRNERLFYF